MLKELLAQQEAFRKELAELRKRPHQQAPAATPQKKPREHTPMLFIEHPPEKKTQQEEDLYWLGAGTWIPCTVEPRLNSDVPGHFTVKTRVPIYDTKTGQRLLIQQNQPIVAKDDAQALLFGNTRIPTFALTLSNPDGSSVELGEMPITDQLGTNGLTGTVNNHIWRLVWTSLFIGGLRGGQQALQAGLTTGDPTGAIAGSVAGQLSQTGQYRLGRAQDTRPTIEVHSGSLCNVLLTKALQLPAIPQRTQARR
jgi:type IV secretion system protein VirB10